MKKENVLDAMEHIDPDMIEEADTYKRTEKTNAWVKWTVLAACLCVCIIGAAKFLPSLQNGRETQAELPQDVGNVPETPAPDYDEGPDFETDDEMISRYDSSLNDEDLAVNNGYWELSNSLKAAIQEYDDSVKYRVVVEVFKDGTVFDSGSNEVLVLEEFFLKNDYAVVHENYEDSTMKASYFTIHATKEQLLQFPVNPSYGYYLSLYDEYLGLDKAAEIQDQSGYVGASEATTEYPEEIAVIFQAIVNAAACGDLPYVIDVSLHDDPLRIEVLVDTADEELIETFKAAYDPTGTYITVVHEGA